METESIHNPKTQLGQFLLHLQNETIPFQVRQKEAQPIWEDAALHEEMQEKNPILYALLAVLPSVQQEQKLRVLFQILQTSRAEMNSNQRQLLEQMTHFLLKILPTDRILTAFLALRKVRANHKHSSRAILSYLINHPFLREMLKSRRRVIQDVIEHAMGKNVARACAKYLNKIPQKLELTQAEQEYVATKLYRFAESDTRAARLFPLIYEKTVAYKKKGEYQLAHIEEWQKVNPEEKAANTLTATSKGDISATLVHLYRGGPSNDLTKALAEYVEEAAQTLPNFAGKMALLLDVSQSTRGYGEREYSHISQSVAFKLVLEKCCKDLKVYTVGSSSEAIPQPEGATDLALNLLDALAESPDLVAIVSDGYENVFAGDLQRVVATLPKIGITTPIVFCHNKFSSKDDLTQRRPATNLPELEFWHQNEWEGLLLTLFAQASEVNQEALETHLQRKLQHYLTVI